MVNGWTGAILHINLTERSHWVDHPDAGTYHRYIGGKGLAGAYYLPWAAHSWDDPEMPLLFMSGPLVGTASPTSGRMHVMSRSPLTGTVGDASVGGSLGTQLKRAGYDGIVLTGGCDALSGIEIVNDAVTFHDARALAGLDTEAVFETIKDKGATVVAGPAAEQGVLFANLMVDASFAVGRNGLGCVFARKNLKYMTVKGSGRIAVYDSEGLKQAREDIVRLIASSPVLLGEQGLTHYGTGAIYDLMASRRMMPTANFRATHFPAASRLNAPAYKKRYGDQRAGCRGCHIMCKRLAGDGKHLPEFETMSHFTALIENEDLDVVTRANQRCSALGMDTITTGATLACYAEIEGIKLSGPEILLLIEDIGHGRGAGRELGLGSYRYAASRGCPELSMSVKKQELAAYDPRGAYGMALAYATSTRGGCHLRAYPISHEILRKPVATDRFSFAGKARMIKIAEDANAVVDSLTACKFVFFACSLEEYAKAYTAVSGVESTAQDLLQAGERIYYNERIMNARNGFSAADDDLPPRFFTEPGSSGNAIEIPPIDRALFLQARSDYYRVRGLEDNGLPTAEKAKALGLAWPPIP
jgi:aldehyde:ferredoxin oxidoreductase